MTFIVTFVYTDTEAKLIQCHEMKAKPKYQSTQANKSIDQMQNTKKQTRSKKQINKNWQCQWDTHQFEYTM